MIDEVIEHKIVGTKLDVRGIFKSWITLRKDEGCDTG